MQVSVEKPEQGLEHKVTVSFPSDDLETRVEKRLKDMRSTVRMDGFRPGKVPLSMVKKRYAGQVRQELLGEAIHHAFFDAADKESLQVAGYPNFEDVNVEDNQIKFTAKFEVYPEVTLPEMSKVKIEQIEAEVNDEDVENMITRLREQRSAWKPENKKAKQGRQVIIDFVGKLDGEEFDGGKAENVPLEIGSGRMIPGFEDGIVGMKKGESKTIEVTFPEEYQAEHLAGKTVEFDITVHSVQVKQLPELDEEFISSFGIEDGKEETLRKEIRENMERELKRTVEAKNRQAAFEALADAVELEIPQALVEQESQSMLENYMQRLESQGMPRDQMASLGAEVFSEEAKKRVKLGLIISDVIKTNEIKATEEEINQYIDDQASAYEDPSEVKQWYAENPERLAEVRAILVESAVASKIVADAKVKASKKAFDEVVTSAA